MVRRTGASTVLLFTLGAFTLAAAGVAAEIGDERALPFHVAQSAIEAGRVGADDLVAAGRFLFAARFTVLDGAGRPGSTGSGLPTRRPLVNARAFLRTSGPDANSCAGCHNQPESGGAGEFVTSVFVGAQEREPVLLSVSSEFSAERGTPEMHGAGLIEMLAREMTGDLHRLRAEAVAVAARERRPERRRLLTKGVDFGEIVALPSGEVDASRADGVDKDLVVRPWSQKGVVTSLRTFTVTALNHHNGMQAVERYGVRRTGSRDFDRDGVLDELTEGDVTALVLFQAALAPPRQVVPADPAAAAAAGRGEEVFAAIGCAECHRPALVLEGTAFTEPGPYNLDGTLRRQDVGQPAVLDFRRQPWWQDLERAPGGGVLVRAFTDLKRHRITDDEQPFYGNEVVAQGFAPTDEFTTRRLWAAASTGPYGHRGDVTTLHQAILYHGGEARGARLAYQALAPGDRGAVIEFLKSLQIVPQAPVPARDEESLHRVAALWRADAAAGDPGERHLVTRAEAAAGRAENSARRARLFALRAEHEAGRAGFAPLPESGLPEPPMLAARLDHLLAAAPGGTAAAVAAALRRTETAVAGAHREAARALGAARFAHPGASDVPLGHRDVEIVAAALERSASGADPGPLIEELLAWCEDQAFRAEQLAQQAGLAATRSEAEARRPVAAPN